MVRAPLVEQAIVSLRDQVVAGVWGVGAQLPAEPVLACELGVGRSTVREAVRPWLTQVCWRCGRARGRSCGQRQGRLS